MVSAESDAVRRKRVRYRAQHRGIKEMDIIFGAFVEVRLADLPGNLLDQFEALLEEPDQTVYQWITGDEPVPSLHDNDLMGMLKALDYVSLNR